MSSVDTAKILTKRNRKAISIKLHPKTLRLLELLSDEIEYNRTYLIESAVWEAFTNGLLTDKKEKLRIEKKIESEFPR
jgi:predicted transcriptional regulator